PRTSDGTSLDPQLHGLSLFRRLIPLRWVLGQQLVSSRLLGRYALWFIEEDTPPVSHVFERVIDGYLRVRIYSPEPKKDLPGCVFFHGGGFVIGNLETHDSFCHRLAREGRCHVISVDYRLAPEYPFPAPVRDAERAFQWVLENGEQLGINYTHLGVAGDSAGGTLATVLCQTRLFGDERPPDFQFLLYPKTDNVRNYPSRELASENLFLNWESVEWFTEQYLSGPCVTPDTDHRLSPIHFNQLDKMPETLLVSAGFDPLRDESEAYAQRLKDNGVRVKQRRYGRLCHGFINLCGIVDRAREATLETINTFREVIADNS
ncbi:MAG: alpha/beta hydrolase, partial [bacterium]